jgi:hypothetical protein
MAVDQHILEAGGVVLALAISKVFDHRKGQLRDKSSGDSIKNGFLTISAKIDQKVGELQRSTDGQFAETNASIARIEAFCIGPDGKNGFRKDIETLTESVNGLIDRERERLADDRLHGYDRRS